MNKEYKINKEYSVVDIIRYNLRMWWLAIILGLLCGVILGGYKYKLNHGFVEKEYYENIQQISGMIYVSDYNDDSATERIGTVSKLATSKMAYDELMKTQKYQLAYEDFVKTFSVFQGEASDFLSFYVNYPCTIGEFNIETQEDAVAYADTVMDTIIKVSTNVLGEGSAQVVDAPYATSIVQKIDTYSISQDEFNKSVFKAFTAGFLLGIIVEIVLYSFWMLLYKKPINAEEVREIFDTVVIDQIKSEKHSAKSYKALAGFLSKDGEKTLTVNCVNAESPVKDTGFKLAMSFAGEQKKTLFIDLSSDGNYTQNTGSISEYVLGSAESLAPVALNNYLDAVYRNSKEEKGFDIAANERFKAYLEQAKKDYDRIVINTDSTADSTDTFVTAKLSDKSFVASGRKNVSNEALFRVKNALDVNGISIEGVLVYEL